MAKVNKHGLKMRGLREVAGRTHCKLLNGYYGAYYLELFYDIESGELWTIEQSSIGHNSWTEYRAQEITKVGEITTRNLKMQDIADMVARHIQWLAYEGREDAKKIAEQMSDHVQM